MLWSEAMTKGFAAPIWMTFKQALELNAHVKKGEKGSIGLHAQPVSRRKKNEGRCFVPQDARRLLAPKRKWRFSQGSPTGGNSIICRSSQPSFQRHCFAAI